MRVTAIKSHGNRHGEQTIQFLLSQIYFVYLKNEQVRFRDEKTTAFYITFQVDPVCLHRTSHWEQSHAKLMHKS